VAQRRYLQRSQHRAIFLIGLYTGRQDAATLRASNGLVKCLCNLLSARFFGRNSRRAQSVRLESLLAAWPTLARRNPGARGTDFVQGSSDNERQFHTCALSPSELSRQRGRRPRGRRHGWCLASWLSSPVSRPCWQHPTDAAPVSARSPWPADRRAVPGLTREICRRVIASNLWACGDAAFYAACEHLRDTAGHGQVAHAGGFASALWNAA
jgi:hypothetical protein